MTGNFKQNFQKFYDVSGRAETWHLSQFGHEKTFGDGFVGDKWGQKCHFGHFWSNKCPFNMAFFI